VILKDEDASAPFIQGVSLPLLLLFCVLLPMTLAPVWLRNASKLNPLTHVVDARRALFRGDFADGNVVIGIAVTLVLGRCSPPGARGPSSGRAADTPTGVTASRPVRAADPGGCAGA